MNRRLFIGSAIAAGASAQPADRPVRIGFLGASHSHAAGKLEVVGGSARFELAGVYDDDPGIRERYRKQGIRISSLDELLSDKSIEVIAVESDVQDHCRHGLMALESGKHLHLEKPPALDIPSFTNLMNLAGRKSLLVQVGYMWRYHPGFMRIFEAVRGGWLGSVYRIDASINKTLEADRRPEWARFAGGQMFELGPHVIDQVVRLLGKPENIVPFLRKHGEFQDNLVDNTIAIFEFPSAFGVVTGAALDPRGSRHRSFAVRGTLGTATLSPIESGDLEFDLSRPAGPYSKGVHREKLPAYKRYVDDFEELAAAVRGRKQLSVTPEEELLVHECVIRASGM